MIFNRIWQKIVKSQNFAKSFSNPSTRFQEISRGWGFLYIIGDFTGFPSISRDFKRFQEVGDPDIYHRRFHGISVDFTGFPSISRDFKRSGIPTYDKRFDGISVDFERLSEIMKIEENCSNPIVFQ